MRIEGPREIGPAKPVTRQDRYPHGDEPTKEELEVFSFIDIESRWTTCLGIREVQNSPETPSIPCVDRDPGYPGHVDAVQ